MDSAVHKYLALSIASSTSASYRSALRRFIEFCCKYSLTPFPLYENTLCHYVVFFAASNTSFQSIRAYLSALRYYQILCGGSDPALASLSQLQYVLREIRRSIPPSVRPRRLPITPAILCLLYQYWSHSANSDSFCLWAACCVAFCAFFRSGKFTCPSLQAYKPHMLSNKDIAVDSHINPTMIRITLCQSKTDVFGAGVEIYLGRTNSIVCPVKALLAYLALRPPTPGPLLPCARMCSRVMRLVALVCVHRYVE